MLTKPQHAPWFTGILSMALLTGAASAQEDASPLRAAVIMTGGYDSYRGVVDLDGDGYLDAIGVWPNDSSGKNSWVRGHRNPGNGTLTYAWAVQPPTSVNVNAGTAAPLAIADYDLDGMPDFAVGNGDKVGLYTGNGLTFPTLKQSWGDLEVTRLLAVDFDQDGRPDVAMIQGGYLEIYFNVSFHGSWNMVLQSSSFVSSSVTELRPIECTGDGLSDVMVADGNLVKMYPVVQGSLGTPIVFDHGQSSPKLDSGDIDNDGDQDATVFGSGTYRVIRRTGPATFVLESQKEGGIARFLVDIDQDGDLDGICCGGGGGSIPDNTKASTFHFAVNDGTGNFAKSWTLPGLGSERVAGWGDMDLDGDLDIVAGRCVLYADGPWTQPLVKPVAVAAGTEWNYFDIDLDGDPDGYYDFGYLGRNAGDGTTTASTVMIPQPPQGHTFTGPGYAGDFDGDGDADLVVQDYVNGFQNNGKRLLRNTGGGAYVDGGAATASDAVFQVGNTFAGNYPAAGIPADVDSDGDLDLVTRYGEFSLTASRLWLNQGTGYFTMGTDFNGQYIENVKDLTGDGMADLLGRLPNGPYTVVTPGLGGGAFAPTYSIGTGTPTPYSRTEVKDLDGDGDFDLALVEDSGQGYRIVKYTNSGGGGFSKSSLANPVAGTNNTACNVWMRDFDGDGAIDLLSTPSGGANNGAEFRRGDGAGGFIPKVNIVLPAVHLLDMDGDGDDDVVAYHNASYVIMANRTHVPPVDGLRRQYGNANAGKGGMTPTLGALGPFCTGSTAEFRVTGGVGGAPGFLVFGITEVNQPDFLLPGLTNFVEPWVAYVDIALDDTPGMAGEGRWSAAIPIDASLAGHTLYFQAFLLDVDSPSTVIGTNGLHLVFGY